MRSILVDYARRSAASKRGGELLRVTLQEDLSASDQRGADLLALDAALERLSENLPRLGQIVEFRFFGGMTVQETAAALDVSVRTVERDWTRARVGAGIALGLGGFLLVARLLAGFLHDVGTADPLALASATALLLAAGLLAALIPARRASRIDPAAVLREE